jgi:hypothetical protein
MQMDAKVCLSEDEELSELGIIGSNGLCSGCVTDGMSFTNNKESCFTSRNTPKMKLITCKCPVHGVRTWWKMGCYIGYLR